MTIPPAPKLWACTHCGHQWWSLLERPKTCPLCKSYAHDQPPRPYKRRARKSPPELVQQAV